MFVPSLLNLAVAPFVFACGLWPLGVLNVLAGVVFGVMACWECDPMSDGL